jgi:sugar phosphate isomerase/epimerase
MSAITERLAVCSWSLQPTAATELFQKLAATGVPRLQIALDPIREQPAAWPHLKQMCAQQGVTCVSGMFGAVGEDYSTLESIRRTGGLVPDATWEENWGHIQANVRLAQQLGLKLVTFHAGFLPHEESDPEFQKLIGRIGQVADLFGEQGIDVGFETGQETAETLRDFLVTLNRPNVGVNFDPANMILYDQGDPIAALRVLGPWLRQCHIKDARRTRQPGTWGEERTVGTGEVDWPAFFRTLHELRFTGFCCIEREAGNQRVADIRIAREYVQRHA